MPVQFLLLFVISLQKAQTRNSDRIWKEIEHPFPGINFTSLNTRHKWLHGKNIGFAAAYCDHLKYNSLPDLIEVHGRCNVAAYLLKKKLPIPLSLYVYNDPREMAGAKSPKKGKLFFADLSKLFVFQILSAIAFLMA